MNCNSNTGIKSKNDKKFLKTWYRSLFNPLKKSKYSYGVASGILLGSLGLTSISQAQVVSDNTTSTKVTTPDGINFNISGGTQAQKNLFHSFSELSVPNGGEAFFNNAGDIENIISRVTGSSISKIDGLIEANGNANLFLINPNGIIFGPNASLKVGGSFIASTANRLVFANGSFFSSTDVQSQPVLTVSIPIGLQFGDTAGVIRSQSPNSEPQPEDPPFPNNGLEVRPSKTLALIGGNLFIEQATLAALEGRIELGSVAENSFVKLTPVTTGWVLGYNAVNNFRDIQLSGTLISLESQQSIGDIQIAGRQIVVTNESQLGGLNFGINQGGNIILKASESVELSKLSSLNTLSLSSGAAGNINISTQRLVVKQGGFVDSSSNEAGRGGNINIYAPEFVEVDGNGGRSKLLAQASKSGNAGELRVTTGKLILRDGGQISSSTAGVGNGGSIFINASNSLEASGQGVGSGGEVVKSGLFAETTSSGNGGIIKINTGQLVVQDGAEISVGSTSTGEAGELEVTARDIRLDNKGKLTSTSVLDTGGGNISLQELNSLTLRRNSEISTSAKGEGNGGNITIDTNLLTALENSNITTTAVRGKGGRIQINTQGIFISPDSLIDAASEQGVDGVVEIDRLENNPENALLTLPAEPVNISGLIAQGCSSGAGSIARRGSEFVVTGRGGLPPTPKEAFRGDVALVDLGKPIQTEATQAKVVTPTNQKPLESTPLVEAQGWVIGSEGEVMLTASAPNVTPSIPWMQSNSCHG